MKRPGTASKPRGRGASTAAPATPGSAAAVTRTRAGFVKVFGVEYQHAYYNANGGRCPDFRTVPTPDCATLMTTLGMIFRDHGDGFGVYIDQARIGPAVNYVAGHYRAAPPGAGYWTFLSFLLMPMNPLFVGITNLPITTSPTMQNLYASNLQTTTVDKELILGPPGGMSQAALYPVTGPTLSVPAVPGCTAHLTDISGAPATSNATGTTFDLSALPYGSYTVVFSGDEGATVPAPITYLYVPFNPVSLCVLDLLLAQPVAADGNSAAFPLDPQQAGSVESVDLVLSFQARDTYWQYFVVSQGLRGQAPMDLEITGSGATFKSSGVKLPTGEQAIRFAATTTLPLRQHSPYQFALNGHREGADGSRGEIKVARLPVAAASPVWPVQSSTPRAGKSKDLDALAGTSEIYVYV